MVLLNFRKIACAVIAVIFLSVNYSIAGTDDAAKIELENTKQNIKNANSLNILGLGLICSGFAVYSSNGQNSANTGKYLFSAGVISFVASGVFGILAGNNAAKIDELPQKPPEIIPEKQNEPAVKETHEQIMTDLKNIGGIAIQEGIEIEKIVISANAQSLGFTKDSIQFKSTAKGYLHEIANVLKDTKADMIEVLGYTDNQGDEILNKQISEARANTVIKFYVDVEGLPKEKFLAKGMGGVNPVADNTNENGRMLNNRVETVFDQKKEKSDTALASKLESIDLIPGFKVSKNLIETQFVVTADEKAIYFASNSFDLSGNDYRTIDKIGQAIISSGKDLENCRVQIKGHSDNVGDKNINIEISRKRARSVMLYLVTQKSLPDGMFECEGCGDEFPIASNDDESGRSKNRRVEVIIKKKEIK